MLSLRTAFLASVIALAASSAAAQTRPMPLPAETGEAIIYRDRNFSGPAVNVSAERANLGLAWSVNSVRLVSGSMELCSAPNFRGTCRTVRQSHRDLSSLGLPGNRVQSMRPVSAPVTGEGAGPSLRGMAAAFYSQPSRNGQRILSCANNSGAADCARRTAEQFCRAQGFNFAGNVSQQTVNRRHFLADVLCRTSAGSG